MAKSTKSTNVQMNLELSIPQDDYAVFQEVAESQSVDEYVKACVTNYLSAYANGGLMLSVEDLEEISEVSGNEITSSSDIVDAVKNTSANNEENCFNIHVDSSLMSNVEESARIIGISVEQWVYNCWGHILANGWLYGISADTTWIPLNKEQCKEIREIIGRDCTSSSDIMEAIAAKSGVK
jgi:hypothetical protein